MHLHQFFSHCFFYAREGRRIRGTACSLEHCFHLVPCEVFKFFSFFVDETLVFDHLLRSCWVTFFNAFWRFFFFSVLSIILRNNSPYDLMKKKNIKDTMEALLSYSGQLMWYMIFYFGGFLLSCDISEELKKISVIERKITTHSPLPLLTSTTAPPPSPLPFRAFCNRYRQYNKKCMSEIWISCRKTFSTDGSTPTGLSFSTDTLYSFRRTSLTLKMCNIVKRSHYCLLLLWFEHVIPWTP